MNTTQRSDGSNAVDWTSKLQSFSRYAADGVIALGCLVILGWIFDIEILKFFFSKLTTMKVNTAFCFILSGTSLRIWHQLLKRQRRTARRLNHVLALSCALLIIVIALLTLIQEGFSVDFGIDQLLLPQPEPIGSAVLPGRMAPNTAIAFVLVGASLLIQNDLSKQNHTNRRTHLLVSQGLALVTGALGLIGLLGHLYGSVYFYTGESYVRMATHTGIAFMFLSSGIICANPQRGLIVLLTSRGAGSLVIRRLLPIAMVLPIFVGGLSQIGHHLHLYSAEVETALSSTINILLLAVLIAWNAQKLNALDLRRERIALDLQASQARFAGIVEFASDAIISVDVNQRIILFNRGAEAIFGYSVGEVLGKPLNLLLPDRLIPTHDQYIRTVEVRTVEATNSTAPQTEERREIYGRRKDGTEFPAEVSISKLELNGEILSTVFLQDITQRKQLERELQQSEAKLNDVLNNVSACIISYRVYNLGPVFRKDDRFIEQGWEYEYCSIGSEYIFGYTPDEFTACKTLWYERVYPDDWQKVLLPRYQRLFTQQTTTDEYRFRHKDGHWRWISETGSARWDDISQSWIVTTVCTDISNRKQVEDTLRQSEATKQAIISAIPDLLIQMKQDGSYVNFISNSKFNVVNPEKIRRDANVRDLLPEDLAQKRLIYTQHTIQTGKLQTYEQQILIQGQLCYEEVRIVPLEQDEVLVMVRDITARKQVEEQLRKSEAMLREAQRIAQVGSWELDVSTHTPTWSKEILQMVGVDPANSELSYSQFFNCIHPDDRTRFQDHLDHAINRGTPYETDLRVLKPDGAIGYLEVRGKPLYNEQGEIIKLFGTALDVTERKHTELELQQAKNKAEAASQAKSMFLASISHELRTPLNVILGFTQVLHRDTSLSAEQQDTIQIIHRSGDHLLNLINDILDLSKIEAGHITFDKSSVDLPNLLQFVMDMLRHRAELKGLKFQYETSSDIPQYIATDVNKLRQILINLLSNAIKFTEKGQITLRVWMEWEREHSRETETDRHTPISLSSPSSPLFLSSSINPSLVFEVEDTGVGIADNEIHAIFDAFVQSRVGKITPGGTGLGLTISHRFVELMGGNLSVESVLGQGTIFTTRIPVQLAEAADIALFSPPQQVIGLVPGQPNYRILAVDDQLENRQLLVKLMQELGLEVRQAANGQEAVAVWQQWHPHLIWMDVWMPLTDGYEATRQIRSLEARNQEATNTQVLHANTSPSQTVIIALTAHASKADRIQVLAAGCNDLITKPVHENWLYDKMTEYLGLKFVYANPSSIDRAELVDRHEMQSTCTAEYVDQHLDEYLIECLKAMPSSWITELYHAVQLCDEKDIEYLIQQIPAPYQELANHLNYLAHEYQFEQLQKLVLQHSNLENNSNLGKLSTSEDEIKTNNY